MTANEFRAVLESLGSAWSERRYEDAARCFAPDVRYIDPCRYALRGRDQVLAFFRDDGGYSQTIVWRQVFFDEAAQIGAAEYSYRGTHLYHGVVLIGIQDGLITTWREYQHTSELDWERFFDGAVP